MAVEPVKPKWKKAEWFETEVAKYLIKSSDKGNRHNGLIRGSSIGSKCKRRISYMLLGYEEMPETAHEAYVLNTGNAYHDMIQSWMVEMNLVKANIYINEQGKVDWKGNAEGRILCTEDGITGHYDGLTEPLEVDTGICALSERGVRYLLEFKTISNRSKTVAVFLENGGTSRKPILGTKKYLLPDGYSIYDKLPPLAGSKFKPLTEKGNEFYLEKVETLDLREGALLDVLSYSGGFSQITKPKQEHIEQATYYASRLGAEKILICYLSKDSENLYKEPNILNIPIKAFESDIDIEIVQQISKKAKDIWEKIERKKNFSDNPEDWLLDREFSPSDYMSECKFCRYNYTCYPNSEDVNFWNKNKLEQRKLLNLPIVSGKPFKTHSINEYGINNAHKVNDKND